MNEIIKILVQAGFTKNGETYELPILDHLVRAFENGTGCIFHLYKNGVEIFFQQVDTPNDLFAAFREVVSHLKY